MITKSQRSWLMVTCAFALVFSVTSPASAESEVAVGIDVGTMAVGLGRGELTIAATAAWSAPLRRISWLRFTARGTGLATGFLTGKPGGMLRGALALGADFGENVRLDVAGELDLLSLRACGVDKCGRLSGIAPAASARLAVYGLIVSDAAGVAASGSVFLPVGSHVLAGPQWMVAFGPIYRFGRGAK